MDRGRSPAAASGNRIYEDIQPQYRWVSSESDETLVVDLTGAGFRTEHLRIQVTGEGNLRVIGERPLGGNRWSRFQEVFRLPEGCDAAGTRAMFEHGLLSVVIPKELYMLPPSPPAPEEAPAQTPPTAPRAPPTTTAPAKEQTTAPAQPETKKPAAVGAAAPSPKKPEELPKGDAKPADPKRGAQQTAPEIRKERVTSATAAAKKEAKPTPKKPEDSMRSAAKPLDGIRDAQQTAEEKGKEQVSSALAADGSHVTAAKAKKEAEPTPTKPDDWTKIGAKPADGKKDAQQTAEEKGKEQVTSAMAAEAKSVVADATGKQEAEFKPKKPDDGMKSDAELAGGEKEGAPEKGKGQVIGGVADDGVVAAATDKKEAEPAAAGPGWTPPLLVPEERATPYARKPPTAPAVDTGKPSVGTVELDVAGVGQRPTQLLVNVLVAVVVLIGLCFYLLYVNWLASHDQ